MRARTVVLAVVVAGLVLWLAAIYAADTGHPLDPLTALGALVPLAILGGFVAFRLREQRLRPDLDPADEDDAQALTGQTVVKYGCLLLAVATAATALFALVQHLLVSRP